MDHELLSSDDHAISSAKDEVLIENKQRQIVQGACKLFFTKGYHPTTIREIAEACDMSMGQLYHYISSKDDVLYLVHKHFHMLQYDFIKAQENKQCNDPVERFVHFLKANLTFIEENKELIQFIMTETKYLKKDYLKLVLEMEKECTIDIYGQLLEDINAVTPIEGNLDVLKSIIAYAVPFSAMRGWTVKGESMDDINNNLVNLIIKGLNLSLPKKNKEMP